MQIQGIQIDAHRKRLKANKSTCQSVVNKRRFTKRRYDKTLPVTY
jgi:hypothetical protein